MLSKNELLSKSVIFVPLNQIGLPIMEAIPRGFKFRTIIDRFAWDLLLILRESLVADSFDSDHVKLRILMTLSDVAENRGEGDPRFNENLSRRKSRRYSYVNNLLFRDYSALKDTVWHSFHLPSTDEHAARTIRIHDEAINYLSHRVHPALPFRRCQSSAGRVVAGKTPSSLR